MIYEPNTTTWKKGDQVIHDCDEKSSKMLMVVTGFTREGYIKTKYLHPDVYNNGRKTYVNELRFLHDPARFNIEV